MSVDLFGRQLKKAEGRRGPVGIGFKYTADGQYDVDNKKICNLAEPSDPNDVVNLITMQKFLKSTDDNITSSIGDIDMKVEKHRDALDKLIQYMRVCFFLIGEKIGVEMIQEPDFGSVMNRQLTQKIAIKKRKKKKPELTEVFE